jgi:drug/metabolite transporter (DMT)-like permease
MLIGLLSAVGAALMWGLVFVAPLMLADYPGILLSLGRYAAFGLIALIPAWFDRRRLAALSATDWIVALKLSLTGNLLYYAALASAIQLADAPLPAMLIGTLPVIIAVFANRSSHRSDFIEWKQLAPSLALISIGLMLVNASEISGFDGHRSIIDYVLGCLITLAALAAWTWYPIVNARHLKANPQLSSSTWATAQGLAILPFAALGFVAYGAIADFSQGTYAFPFGSHPYAFIGLMLVLGVCASWLGTLLWNRASQRLPTTLAGQLIVVETLAALLYAYLMRGAMPPGQVLAGALLLCLGVIQGVRAFRAS